MPRYGDLDALSNKLEALAKRYAEKGLIEVSKEYIWACTLVDAAPTADVAPADQLRAIISGAICGACDVFPHGGMTQTECVPCILRHIKKVIGEEAQDGK